MAAKSTEDGEPVHMIPPDCYDVGDGYYVPANRTVYAYPGAGEFSEKVTLLKGITYKSSLLYTK